MVQLTDKAQQEIDRLRRRQNQPDAICRLDLQPSSCAQWSYKLSLETTVEEMDDTFSFGQLQLVVNRNHAQYIQNLKIDFAED
ncbi:MAG: iron-sulfur cluster biosynthesis family protein, partial [Cyanobacteria bacterium J06598_1]